MNPNGWLPLPKPTPIFPTVEPESLRLFDTEVCVSVRLSYVSNGPYNVTLYYGTAGIAVMV